MKTLVSFSFLFIHIPLEIPFIIAALRTHNIVTSPDSLPNPRYLYLDWKHLKFYRTKLNWFPPKKMSSTCRFSSINCWQLDLLAVHVKITGAIPEAALTHSTPSISKLLSALPWAITKQWTMAATSNHTMSSLGQYFPHFF